MQPDSTAAARIGLLLAATLIFVAIRTSDRSHENARPSFTTRRPAAEETTASLPAAAPERSVPTTAFVPLPVDWKARTWRQTVATWDDAFSFCSTMADYARQEMRNVAMEDQTSTVSAEDCWVAWQQRDQQLRLPTAITPGRYQVADNTGRTRVIDLTSADLADLGIACGGTPENLYTLVDGDRRWYFIRIDAADNTSQDQFAETQSTLPTDVTVSDFNLQASKAALKAAWQQIDLRWTRLQIASRSLQSPLQQWVRLRARQSMESAGQWQNWLQERVTETLRETRFQ